MRERWLAGLALTCALSAHGADRAQPKSAAKSQAPDLDFLEYLGTLESDEENWTDVAMMELPSANGVENGTANTLQGKPSTDSRTPVTAKGKTQPEAAAKSAGSEK